MTSGAGGALLLRGPNGAGKSSLLRALAGLTPLAAGRLLWNGEDALEDLATHAGRIAWLGHQDAVKPALTVAEHVADRAALGALGLEGYAPAAGAVAVGWGRSAAWRWRGWWRPGRRSGCWMSRAMGWTRLPTRGWPGLLAAHRAAGGMVIASTHAPLDLPGAATLAL